MWPSERRILLVGILAAGLLASACVEHTVREVVMPTRYEVAVPPPEAPPETGSIWRGGSSGGSFLYFDRKARGVGDLVTVEVDEEISADGGAETNTERESGLGFGLSSDIGFAQLLAEGARVLFKAIGIKAPDVDTSATVNAIETSGTSSFDGKGTTSREGKFSGTVTCRVVEALPGGIFHIYGRRQLLVNHELQLVTVEGYVRREDIGIDNIVSSAVLADARLTYDGIGVVDDKQRPSVVTRFFDWVYPF